MKSKPLNIVKKPASAPVKLSRDEKIARTIQNMKWKVEEANELRNKLIAEMSKNNLSAIYQIEWMQGKSETMIKGAWFEEVISIIEKNEKPVELVLEEFIASLQSNLKTWRPQNSTSQFSNVVTGEKFTAMRDVLEFLTYRLEDLKDAS